MADTSIASNSRQRLRQLIGDLLFSARRASCETESVGRLVGQTCFLDYGKARSAAAYLTELGLAGDAVRLLEDVGHLRRHADEVFQRSISPRTEPHDLEQAQRDLESLNSEASRLVVFLRELESFCVNENASPTPPAKPDEGEGNADSTLTDQTDQNYKEDGTNFVFASEGDGYFIDGFGESGHVRNLMGFGIIARLVQTPSIPVPMVELVGAAGDPRVTADQRSRQPAMDEQAKRELYQRLQQTIGELERAKAAKNTVEEQHCQDEIDHLQAQLRAAVGVFNKDRDINSETEKLRPKIHGVLRTAYKHLREARPSMKELADHFEAAISAEGKAFVYKPVQPIQWTSWPSAKK